MPDKVQAAVDSMAENLKAKTGRSLDDWVKVVKKAGLARHKEIMEFLKSKHGLTHGYANLVALTALKADSGPGSGDDLVNAQYRGARAELRPLYEAILDAVQTFGPDVEVSPKKTYVSLRRRKQFALLQPSTAGRIDVGLNLKGARPEGRLEASGSFNAMCTHRVRVNGKKDLNAELIGWLKKAYQSA
jgi:hypothetical protein